MTEKICPAWGAWRGVGAWPIWLLAEAPRSHGECGALHLVQANCLGKGRQFGGASTADRYRLPGRRAFSHAHARLRAAMGSGDETANPWPTSLAIDS